MNPQDNIVRNADGQPVVPYGAGDPMSGVPKDTLPRPAPQSQMPSPAPVDASQLPPNAPLGITFEELAAKKGFKSPDDLAKAYANLESQNKRVEATLSEAIEARQNFYNNNYGYEQQPQNQQMRVEEAQTPEDALRIVDQRILSQTKRLEDMFDYKIYLLEHPADRQYSQEAVQIVKDNPGIRWEIAFKAAKADRIAQEEYTKGKEEAYNQIGRKEDLQVPHSSARSVDSGKTDIKDFIQGIKTGQIPLGSARAIINQLSNNIQ